uniref:Hypotheticial protein n=1 Tax=Schistosoma japonicum TaxID=6182 RepID=C1LM25_SCHJA|nr:hypotheticial protein [Schistosoma japonicum]
MIMVHKFWLLVIAIFINVVVDQSNAAIKTIPLELYIPVDARADVYVTKCFNQEFLSKYGVKSNT